MSVRARRAIVMSPPALLVLALVPPAGTPARGAQKVGNTAHLAGRSPTLRQVSYRALWQTDEGTDIPRLAPMRWFCPDWSVGSSDHRSRGFKWGGRIRTPSHRRGIVGCSHPDHVFGDLLDLGQPPGAQHRQL